VFEALSNQPIPPTDVTPPIPPWNVSASTEPDAVLLGGEGPYKIQLFHHSVTGRGIIISGTGKTQSGTNK